MRSLDSYEFVLSIQSGKSISQRLALLSGWVPTIQNKVKWEIHGAVGEFGGDILKKQHTFGGKGEGYQKSRQKVTALK